MAAVTICSDFGAQKNKVWHGFHCFPIYVKAFDCVDHNKLWEILQEMEYQTTWPASWETYMQVRKQQLELDMEQQTGSKSGKEYVKAVYCHLLI